jgi:hypothetical protein
VVFAEVAGELDELGLLAGEVHLEGLDQRAGGHVVHAAALALARAGFAGLGLGGGELGRQLGEAGALEVELVVAHQAVGALELGQPGLGAFEFAAQLAGVLVEPHGRLAGRLDAQLEVGLEVGAGQRVGVIGGKARVVGGHGEGQHVARGTG